MSTSDTLTANAKAGDPDEDRRQQAIERYQLADPRHEEVFERITSLAASLFDVPIAIVTVLTEDRQLFRGAFGIDPSGTARAPAFCNATVGRDGCLVIEDARVDANFCASPLVTGEPGIRFYAGAPIRVGDGVAIGSLCLIDRRPRQFDAAQQAQLVALAGTVADLIHLRLGSLHAAGRERLLEGQAQILTATIDNIEEGVAVFDDQLNLKVWNRLWFDLLGFDNQWQKEGISAADLLRIAAARGDFGPGTADDIVAQLIGNIRTTPSRRMDLHTADGRLLEVWRAAMSGGGQIITVDDVTHRHEMARIKDEFVATVSHELRTPLTSIRGALALLQRDLANGQAARGDAMLAIAQRNSERLGELIDDILDIEKLASGTSAFVMLPTDLREAIDEAVEENHPFARTLEVELKVDRPSMALVVDGDPGRLVQVLTNLISNAAKHSPPGRTVTVTALGQGARVRVEVTDEGKGVAPSFVGRLFERFSQAERMDRRGLSGTGLGLAISRAIVERHGGSIGYVDRPGGGACFWFDLPLLETAS